MHALGSSQPSSTTKAGGPRPLESGFPARRTRYRVGASEEEGHGVSLFWPSHFDLPRLTPFLLLFGTITFLIISFVRPLAGYLRETIQRWIHLSPVPVSPDTLRFFPT